MSKPPRQLEVVGNVLAVKWDDDRESYLDLEALRRACPCAHCAGEPDVTGAIRRPAAPPVYGESSFEVVATEWIGNYAVAFTWGDGHKTGIYAWELLDALDGEQDS